MVDVAALSGSQNSLFGRTSSSESSLSSSSATIADNFETFLQLLTTQLQNQNPLEPLGVNEFTQQLVQFAEVEQGLQNAKQNEEIIALQNSLLASNVLGMIDQTVYIDGNSNVHNGNGATWQVNADKDAASTTIVVRNEQGVEVFKKEQALSSGRNSFAWDGRDNEGNLVANGTYNLVVSAETEDQIRVPTTTQFAGTVTSVDVTGTTPRLRINGELVPLSRVVGVGAY